MDKFNLKSFVKQGYWSTSILKEEYDHDNFIIHNGERGIYCNYVPNVVTSKIEKRKTPARWTLYLLHGSHPNFIFTNKCKYIGHVEENKKSPDKQKAKDLAIHSCKELFEKGRFDVSDSDIINAPTTRYAFNLKRHKQAVHGTSPFNYNDSDNYRGNSWMPVNPSKDPYSASWYTTHVPQFGGDTFGKKRREFNNLSNANNTNDEKDNKNTKHTDPTRDYNDIWNVHKLNKDEASRMGEEAPELWQIVAPAGKNPDRAAETLKQKFPSCKIKVENNSISVLAPSMEMSLEIEKYLANAKKMKL
jgi:hypothetical protein